MTDVRCVDCSKFSLQLDPEAAVYGRGKCAEEKLPSGILASTGVWR